MDSLALEISLAMTETDCVLDEHIQRQNSWDSTLEHLA